MIPAGGAVRDKNMAVWVEAKNMPKVWIAMTAPGTGAFSGITNILEENLPQLPPFVPACHIHNFAIERQGPILAEHRAACRHLAQMRKKFGEGFLPPR
jgi:hypothetical protein